MKNLFKIVVIICSVAWSAKAQNYICRDGQTSFLSETPLENIAANNSKVASVLNIATSEIAVKITITDFRFKNSLMQEHFNENYMESSKFPNAVFKGKIQETIDWKKDGTYTTTAKGMLTMHGVSKERILNGKTTIEKGKITLTTDFSVALVEHKIDVPKIVLAKIAENIAVKNKFVFVPLK